MSDNNKYSETMHKISSVITPILLLLIGFLAKDKLETIENRLEKLENLNERVIILETKNDLTKANKRNLSVPQYNRYAILNKKVKVPEGRKDKSE